MVKSHIVRVHSWFVHQWGRLVKLLRWDVNREAEIKAATGTTAVTDVLHFWFGSDDNC